MVVVGWLTSRNKGGSPEVQHEVHKEKKSADDLTKLEGIGPKVAKVLNEAGIMSFADLAHAEGCQSPGDAECGRYADDEPRRLDRAGQAGR